MIWCTSEEACSDVLLRGPCRGIGLDHVHRNLATRTSCSSTPRLKISAGEMFTSSDSVMQNGQKRLR